MQITRNRIRRDYQPLSVAAEIAVVTAGDSPLTQVYDGLQGTYQPDRELTPLVLMPRVTLTASDGSMPSALTNKDIAKDTMRWLLDGRDITAAADWKDKVAVADPADDTRGRLTIARNVKPGETHALRFECDVADRRTGKNVHVTTDTLVLSTTDKSEDDWTIAVEGARNVSYDPVTDTLAEMEYEMAHGTATYNDAELEEARKSGGSYVRRWDITVRKGRAAAPKSLYSVSYYMHDGKARNPVTAENMAQTPLAEMAQDHVTIDMRLVDNCTLTAEVTTANGEKVAAVTLGAARAETPVAWDYLNKTEATATEDMRDDMILARSAYGTLKHPERTHNIVWFVEDAAGKSHELNMGARTRYSMKEYGLADTADIAEYVATEAKPPHVRATDAAGAVLTDGHGRELVFTTLGGD